MPHFLTEESNTPEGLEDLTDVVHASKQVDSAPQPKYVCKQSGA